jgi:hypothetical protein
MRQSLKGEKAGRPESRTYGRDSSVWRALLRRAYSLSRARTDRINLLHVAHSLAQYYVDESRNDIEGRKWLDVLKRHLVQIDNASYRHDHQRLSEELVRRVKTRTR